MNRIIKDMETVLDQKTGSPELQNLADALKVYMKKSQVTDSAELVDLFLLVSAIMDAPEETWNLMVKRLHRILVKRETGIDVQEVARVIKMFSEPNKGPVN